MLSIYYQKVNLFKINHVAFASCQCHLQHRGSSLTDARKLITRVNPAQQEVIRSCRHTIHNTPIEFVASDTRTYINQPEESLQSEFRLNYVQHRKVY